MARIAESTPDNAIEPVPKKRSIEMHKEIDIWRKQTLNIVVKAQNFIAVAIENHGGVFVAEVFELNQSLWPALGHCADKLVEHAKVRLLFTNTRPRKIGRNKGMQQHNQQSRQECRDEYKKDRLCHANAGTPVRRRCGRPR